MSVKANARSKLRHQILLNVYDLHPNNNYTMLLGLGGAFHTGVEIGFIEYSYGGNITNETGIFECEPRLAYGAIYRETIEMGYIDTSTVDFKKILSKLKQDFIGNDYHILNRNCNTFCNELLIRLMGQGLPSYITRLTKIGSLCSCLLPEALTNPNATRARSSEDSSSIPLTTSETTTKSTFTAFSTPGYSLTSANNNYAQMEEDDTQEARRAKIAEATKLRLATNDSNNKNRI